MAPAAGSHARSCRPPAAIHPSTLFFRSSRRSLRVPAVAPARVVTVVLVIVVGLLVLLAAAAAGVPPGAPSLFPPSFRFGSLEILLTKLLAREHAPILNHPAREEHDLERAEPPRCNLGVRRRARRA